MRLRTRYLIAGVAWALLLGPAAALALFGFAAGVSWLWLFGDDPWPEATRWALPLIGLAGGIVVAALCILLAFRYGRGREDRSRAGLPRERRKALLLTAVPLALIGLAGAMLWKQAVEYSEAMNLATQREAAFAALVGTRHEITGLTVEQEGSNFHGVVEFAGSRDGRYRMQWQVSETSFGTVLAGGERTLFLQEGRQEVEIQFALETLARSYRDRVLSGGGVLVDEPFRLVVMLEPVLTDAHLAAFPPAERNRLELGESPLRVRQAARFPVRFSIGRDGSVDPG